MSKNSSIKREAKKYKECDFKPNNVIEYEQNKNKLEPLNESQRTFISNLYHDELVIGAGAAGTGKTYLASRVAASLFLKSKNIKQIIMTRPNVEVGKSMGFLPGDLDEKYEPYLQPFEKGLSDELGVRFKASLNKTILPQPLGYMRGKTFDDSIMLLDEAQNTTVEEMKMFLSRVGTNSRIFITGDESGAQTDLRTNKNGLQWLIEQINGQCLTFALVRFTSEDCVRSELCYRILQMIENEV